ncbi:hypothetical protein ACFLX9_00775 [Chloroflexota bacterium]
MSASRSLPRASWIAKLLPAVYCPDVFGLIDGRAGFVSGYLRC